MNIAAVCQHFGEEPVLGGKNGVLNIFFSHCNLQCVYCQNKQISNNLKANNSKIYSIDELFVLISKYIEKGINYIGFVTPTLFLPHVVDLSTRLKNKYSEIFLIYNTNAYENVDKLKILEGLIDIYLPDFKYANDNLAERLSNVNNYKSIAIKSIKEMVRQKGTSIIFNNDGLAESGVIVRHLILPNFINNSIEVLKVLSEEVSNNLYISLMSQYNPIDGLKDYKKIQRKLNSEELKTVEAALDNYGFFRGWTQELSSANYYNPNFDNENPFL